MKSKYFLTVTFILIIIFFSCEKEIEFNGDDIKTKLVLNGLLMPDSLVKINLTESKFFLDNDRFYKGINNATVELWNNGSKIENLSNIGEGYYAGNYISKTGDNIKILASCEGFDKIECSTEIVVPTPIISVDTMNYREERLYNYYYSEDGNYGIDSSSYYMVINSDMFITFKDPKNIPNYYNINLYLKYYFSDGVSIFFPVSYNSDDLVFQTVNETDFFNSDDYLRSTLFNDELLDGKEYKLKIKTNNFSGINLGKNPYNPDYETTELVGMEILVDFQSLSYEYYMYLKTRDADSNMNDLFEYFAEPVQIYTNVKGGIGILGSCSNSVFKIPLK